MKKYTLLLAFFLINFGLSATKNKFTHNDDEAPLAHVQPKIVPSKPLTEEQAETRIKLQKLAEELKQERSAKKSQGPKAQGRMAPRRLFS